MNCDTSNTHENVLDPTESQAGGALWICMRLHADGTICLRERAGGARIARFNVDRAGGRIRSECETRVVAAGEPDRKQ